MKTQKKITEEAKEQEGYVDGNKLYKEFSKFQSKSETKEAIIDNQISLLKEDIWCVHKYLDDLKIPREDDDNKTYSIVGRIKRLEVGFLKQMSDLETFYLRETDKSVIEAKEVKSAEELYCIKFKFPKNIIPHLDRKRDVTLKLSSIFDLMNEFANQYKVK